MFEVDHPATQTWKRGRLKETGIAIPDSVTFGGLRQAGFRVDESAFFSMLGVVPYLTRKAAIDTLKVVASLPPGTEIVFDCAIPRATLGEEARARHDDAAGVVGTRGEPWLTFFEPATLGSELRALGLTQVEDLGSDDLHERYFKSRTDGLRLPALARLVRAGR